MLSTARVMMIHRNIVEHHGRVQNVKLFDKDPTNFINAAKEREEQRARLMKELEKAKKMAEEHGEEIEESKEVAAALAAVQAIPEESKEPEYRTFDDPSMTIFDIFGEYGRDSKKEIDGVCTKDTDDDGNPVDKWDPEPDKDSMKELYYDFTPFNAKDPVLLSLMTAK